MGRNTVLKLEKYTEMAKELEIADAPIIASEEIYFDIRAILKGRWGCEGFFDLG